MCKSKMATNAIEPNSTARRSSKIPKSSASRRSSGDIQLPAPLNVSDPSSTSYVTTASYTSGSGYRLDTSTATASISSRASLSSLRDSLPENAHVYDFDEIRAATNNFLAKRHSSPSTPSWRCTLRGKDAVVFQRRIRRSMETSELSEKLSVICRSHHISIIKLLGASISGNYIYLVYEFVPGANLADCLRNPRNPDYTVLSTWMSRMQIATDLAHGLDYIHNNAGLNVNLVHKHVKSSGVIVTEPSFNAKICHFGTAELCDKAVTDRADCKFVEGSDLDTIVEDFPASPSVLNRSDSRNRLQFEGMPGYMSPEFLVSGVATRKSDVYAFGVVILELLSGEMPVKFIFNKASGEYRKISVIDGARRAVEGEGVDGVEGRLRQWIDRNLKDSFPVEVAEKMARVALDCVRMDPDERPNMRRVAGKISKLYLDTRIWSDRLRLPTEFTVSLAPR